MNCPDMCASPLPTHKPGRTLPPPSNPDDPQSLTYRLTLALCCAVTAASLALEMVQAAKFQRQLDDVDAGLHDCQDTIQLTRQQIREVHDTANRARNVAAESSSLAIHAHTRLDRIHTRLDRIHTRLDRIHSTNGYRLETGGRKMDVLCVDAEPEPKVEQYAAPHDYTSTSCVTSCAIPGDGYYVVTGSTTLEPFKPTIRRLP